MNLKENKTVCELLAEYGLFDSQENRSDFMSKSSFGQLMTLFSVKAFLLGPFAYIFSRMYLIGIWWMMAIFLVSLLCQTIEHFVPYPFIIAQINILPLWWLVIIIGVIIVLKQYALAHVQRIGLYIALLYAGMIVSTLIALILWITVSAILYFVFKINLAPEMAQYVREAAPANVIIAFLYTIDRCKQTASQSR